MSIHEAIEQLAEAFAGMKRDLDLGALLGRLGIEATNDGAFSGEWHAGGSSVPSISPIDGQSLAEVRFANAGDYERVAARALAPLRGAGAVRGYRVIAAAALL